MNPLPNNPFPASSYQPEWAPSLNWESHSNGVYWHPRSCIGLYTTQLIPAPSRDIQNYSLAVLDTARGSSPRAESRSLELGSRLPSLSKPRGKAGRLPAVREKSLRCCGVAVAMRKHTKRVTYTSVPPAPRGCQSARVPVLPSQELDTCRCGYELPRHHDCSYALLLLLLFAYTYT